MRKFRFSETQIVKMLKEGEAGRPVAEICREQGISATTFYKWKTKYRGMENELLWQRVRRPGPLAKRRSKK